METIDIKYKEKLRLAKEALESGSYDKDTIEHIFPELKDSKDERIRKRLLKIANVWKEGGYACGNSDEIDDIIAWLEKQGEPIDKIVKRATTEKQRVLLTETNGDANIDWDTRSLQDVKLLLEYGLDYIKKLEKQGDTDVVEPRFKVGDYIKHNKANIIYKIISVNSGSYYVENIETGGRIELFNAELKFHLWTIKDAKDGDVIFYDDGWTCIFKHIHGIWFSSYCFITANGVFNMGYERHAVDTEINGNAYPAAKERRDILFAKMKEAGYDWNAEKKQVIKL